MRTLSYAILCAAVVGGDAMTCDARTSEACVRTIGASGKVLYCPGSDSSNETGCFVIRLRKFEEWNADGELITAHRVNNLGNAGMAVGSLNNSYSFPTKCNDTTPVCGSDGDDNPVTAVQIPITAPIGGKTSQFATLDVTMYILTANGSLTFAGETVDVQVGSLKFDINVRDYTPCGSGEGYEVCRKGNTEEAGDHFTFTVEMTPRGGGQMEKKGDTLVAPNGDVLVNFENYKLQAVGSTEWTTEPASVTVAQGSEGKQEMSYKFKIGQKVVYDPMYSTAGSQVIDTPAPTGSSAATLPAFALLLLSAVFALVL